MYGGLLSVLWTFFVASAVATSPLRPDSLGDLCASLTLVTAAVDRTLQTLENPTPDPEMDRRRTAAANALVGFTLRTEVERTSQFSRAASIIAKEVIYNIEQYLGGELRTSEANDMAGHFAKRIVRLIEDGEEVRRLIEAARSSVSRMEHNLDDDCVYITGYIAWVQNALEETRRAMDFDRRTRLAKEIDPPIFGIALLFQDLLITSTDDAAATVMEGTSLTYNEIISRAHTFKHVIWTFGSELKNLGAVIEGVQHTTEVHIRFWSHMLHQLKSLETTGKNWIEDPWTANELLAYWKMVLHIYNECTTS